MTGGENLGLGGEEEGEAGEGGEVEGVLGVGSRVGLGGVDDREGRVVGYRERRSVGLGDERRKEEKDEQAKARASPEGENATP